MTDNQIEKIERLNEVMSVKKIKQAEMANLIGLGRPNLSAIINKRENRTLPYGTSYILETELGISRDWFEKGEGEMHKTSLIGNSDYEINERGAPMYNVPGSGGGVELYTDGDSEKIVGYLNFPGITKGSFALPVYGHSMYPTLENGVWVVLRPIENKLSIVWGEVYYVEYDDYRVFKRLLSGDTEDDVILWSDNQSEVIQDKPKFSQIKIQKTDIRMLCLVTDIYKKSNN